MSISVYIVEDERIVAEDIRVTLESRGYIVAGIASGRDAALAGIRQTSPHLVLMDIVLKGQGDGIEAARVVREEFDIPVVYMTAHADQATLQRAKMTEPFGYIVKPFEERELFSTIEMALYRHRAEKRIEEDERWFATVLGSISDGVIAADAMGAVKVLNAAAERIGGWTHADAAGRDLAEVYPVWDPATGQPVDVPSLAALFESQGEHVQRQVRLLHRKDGGRTLIEQSIAPISDGHKTVSGTVVVFRELSVAAGTPGSQP